MAGSTFAGCHPSNIPAENVRSTLKQIDTFERNYNKIIANRSRVANIIVCESADMKN